MKKITSLAAAAAIIIPATAFAGGIGLVVPVGLGYTETIEGDYGGSIDRDIGSYVGFGIVFDNNLGKNALVNKRTVIEYSNQSVSYEGDPKGGSYSLTTWNIASLYGFGIIKNEHLRLAIGPRINVKYAYSDNSLYDDAEIGIGIAPAVSLNWNINQSLSLSADLDYKFQYNFGDLAASSYYYSSSYNSVSSDLTARLYVMYRFGEENMNYTNNVATDMDGVTE